MLLRMKTFLSIAGGRDIRINTTNRRNIFLFRRLFRDSSANEKTSSAFFLLKKDGEQADTSSTITPTTITLSFGRRLLKQNKIDIHLRVRIGMSVVFR